MDFGYEFDGPGFSGTAKGWTTPVRVTQLGRRITVAGNPGGEIDAAGNVIFSGNIVDWQGTQHFEGTYDADKGEITGAFLGTGYDTNYHVRIIIGSGTFVMAPLADTSSEGYADAGTNRVIINEALCRSPE